MSAYRFVVFPRGMQPTTDDVAALADVAPALGHHIAWGVDRARGGVAVAFEAEPFERTLAGIIEFQALLHRWQARGCVVLEKSEFVKDSAALRPIAASTYSRGIHPLAAGAVAEAESHGRSPALDRLLVAKQNLAHDAVARAKLQFDRTVQRYESLSRFATAAPYLAMGFGALLILAAGWYVSVRILDSPRERRQQTIERLADDPLREPLAETPPAEQPAEEP
ncbi:MAG: hypothetical protein KF688_17705 [Pirellulales bacterium]|nr:hypothetical protein [Pirellulales bacterium]